MNKLSSFLTRYREFVSYSFFGILTTIINLAVFTLLEGFFGTANSYLYTNVIAWFVGVVFAYITNKLIVFRCKSWSIRKVLPEAAEFFGARALSLIVEEAGLWLFIDLWGWGKLSTSVLGFDLDGGLIAKAILVVIVIIINYVFSKFIIFKKTEE